MYVRIHSPCTCLFFQVTAKDLWRQEIGLSTEEEEEELKRTERIRNSKSFSGEEAEQHRQQQASDEGRSIVE